MRGMFPAFLTLALAAPAGAALAADDPTALVEALYQQELLSYSDSQADAAEPAPAPTDPALRAQFFTPRLIGLLDYDDARAEDEGMGCLDFDPVANAQDVDLSDLEIVADGPPEQGRVRASFRNFEDRTTLIYQLEQQPEGWRIADIQSVDGDYTWSLLQILSCDE